MNKTLKFKSSKTREQKLFLLIILILLVTFFFSLTVGRYELEWANILKVIKLKVTNQPVPADYLQMMLSFGQ